jgi:hypothetical protein
VKQVVPCKKYPLLQELRQVLPSKNGVLEGLSQESQEVVVPEQVAQGLTQSASGTSVFISVVVGLLVLSSLAT